MEIILGTPDSTSNAAVSLVVRYFAMPPASGPKNELFRCKRFIKKVNQNKNLRLKASQNAFSPKLPDHEWQETSPHAARSPRVTSGYQEHIPP